MVIKILGAGCSSCHRLEKNLRETLAEIDKDVRIEKVKEFKEILNYGVMTTPALVVDGKVVSAGKVLTTKELKELLSV